jgi:hypothetical protein
LPVNGFTVGRDVTITMAGSGGTIVIPSAQVTHFAAKAMKKQTWSRPLNSPPQPIYMPDGWQGSVSVDRADSTLDTFQSTLESNFWNGRNTLAGTIMQTITEDDGSTTQFQFINAMFWIENVGDYAADGIVKQSIEFCSGERKRVA